MRRTQTVCPRWRTVAFPTCEHHGIEGESWIIACATVVSNDLRQIRYVAVRRSVHETHCGIARRGDRAYSSGWGRRVDCASRPRRALTSGCRNLRRLVSTRSRRTTPNTMPRPRRTISRSPGDSAWPCPADRTFTRIRLTARRSAASLSLARPTKGWSGGGEEFKDLRI